MKTKFPKKAKLIADGGFYRIIDIHKYQGIIYIPTMRRIIINTPEIDYNDLIHFELKFEFRRIYRGYAEYKQIDCVHLLNGKEII